MSKLTIFRGLPGSGKSYKARELSNKTGAILIEPDSLCTIDGTYCFNHTFSECVKTAYDLVSIISERCGADIIYADVLPSKHEIEELIGRVSDDYEIEIITNYISKEESLKRNTHLVIEEDINKMIESWEEYE